MELQCGLRGGGGRTGDEWIDDRNDMGLMGYE